MNTLTRFTYVAVAALLLGAGAYGLYANRMKTPVPNPVGETPATSTAPIPVASATTTSDLIHVTNPLPNQQVQSPLVVTGEARGTWFFEASFPVVLTDWDGRIIAQGIAQAEGDWMTNNFVPFKATIPFTLDPNVYSNRGSLILRKDNPSGLPQNDKAFEIPIMFATSTKPIAVCTQEAKLCPDGSAVGRTGPNCEFDPCPSGTVISFLTSKEDSTKYCNGADMDSAGYQKTITIKHTTTSLERTPTQSQIIKETIHAATTGMCRTVLDELDVKVNGGVVTIPPIDGWAGVSITMCSCRPIVETNVLRIPGVTKVIWQ